MTTTLQLDYKSAFKDADIRGVYPTEINEELVYLIARAFVEEFDYKKILVARDMRLSTPQLYKAFLKGAVDSGASVIDIGQVHSPALYFASATMNLPGVMITASHSPKKFNGLKLVHSQAIPLTEQSGLGKLKRRIGIGKFTDSKKIGKVTQKNVLRNYQKFVLKGYKVKKFDGIKILADTGNGMAGVLLPILQEKLPTKFEVMFPELDGNFPNRGSNPTLSKHQKPIKAELKKGNYDFGVAFDGDSDRVAFFDEKGNYINSAVIGALIVKQMLKSQDKAKIGYTVLTSRSYEETIREMGGRPVLMRVGHAFIKKAMREKDVLFACEHSGHFYFKDYFFTDSVTLTLLTILEVYSEARKAGQTFSEMTKPYLKYQQAEDLMVDVKDKKLALKKVEDYLKGLKPKTLKHFDGLIVDFGNVWGAVKPSVTEYALNVMFESLNRKTAVEMQSKLIKYIQSIAND